MKLKLIALLASSALLSLSSAVLAATEDAEFSDAERPVHCLSLIRIKNSDILDSQHILFETVGGKYYLNQLPHNCPGLSHDDAFMYRTSLNKLCDLDVITLLDDHGFGLLPGASCGLGVFEPISEEQIAGLKQSLEAAKKSRH